MKKKLKMHSAPTIKNRGNGASVSLFIGVLILLDVFLFPVSADIRIFAILGMYILLIFRSKLQSNTTFSIGLILLCLAYVQFLFTDQKVFGNPGPVPPLAERTAVWVYLFMVIGVIQKWKE